MSRHAAAVLTTRGQQRDLTSPPPQVAALLGMFWAVFTSPNRDFLFPQWRLPVLPVKTSCFPCRDFLFRGAALIPTDEAAGQAAPDGKGGEAAASPLSDQLVRLLPGSKMQLFIPDTCCLAALGQQLIGVRWSTPHETLDILCLLSFS